jgi:hypothetical protein
MAKSKVDAKALAGSMKSGGHRPGKPYYFITVRRKRDGKVVHVPIFTPPKGAGARRAAARHNARQRAQQTGQTPAERNAKAGRLRSMREAGQALRSDPRAKAAAAIEPGQRAAKQAGTAEARKPLRERNAPAMPPVAKRVGGAKVRTGGLITAYRLDTTQPRIGDKLAPSRVWNDDVPTGKELPGTSAFSTREAAERHAKFAMGSVVAIRGNKVTGAARGRDKMPGEVLLQNATVSEVLSIKRNYKKPRMTPGERLALAKERRAERAAKQAGTKPTPTMPIGTARPGGVNMVAARADAAKRTEQVPSTVRDAVRHALSGHASRADKIRQVGSSLGRRYVDEVAAKERLGKPKNVKEFIRLAKEKGINPYPVLREEFRKLNPKQTGDPLAWRTRAQEYRKRPLSTTDIVPKNVFLTPRNQRRGYDRYDIPESRSTVNMADARTKAGQRMRSTRRAKEQHERLPLKEQAAVSRTKKGTPEQRLGVLAARARGRWKEMSERYTLARSKKQQSELTPRLAAVASRARRLSGLPQPTPRPSRPPATDRAARVLAKLESRAPRARYELGTLQARAERVMSKLPAKDKQKVAGGTSGKQATQRAKDRVAESWEGARRLDFDRTGDYPGAKRQASPSLREQAAKRRVGSMTPEQRNAAAQIVRGIRRGDERMIEGAARMTGLPRDQQPKAVRRALGQQIKRARAAVRNPPAIQGSSDRQVAYAADVRRRGVENALAPARADEHGTRADIRRESGPRGEAQYLLAARRALGNQLKKSKGVRYAALARAGKIAGRNRARDILG